MPALLEVNYFNSFWLKKVVDDGKQWGYQGAAVSNGGLTPNEQTSFQPIYPGSDPSGGNVCGTNTTYPGGFGLGFYPTARDTPGQIPMPTQEEIEQGKKQTARCWYIEESRIRGGYNNDSVDLGVRAYLTMEAPNNFTRLSSMIYSGVFNSRTNVNETNQFPVGSDITKTADPHYGSIQKMFAEDGNLIVFQEDKVSRALIDKDLIYSAEGAPMSTQSNVVIGQITPYVGEYGISKNPESFAVFGYRKYFVDKDRGCVLRLSRDGMTEISGYGMTDFFRDYLASMPDNKVAWSIQAELISGAGNNVTSFEILNPETVAPAYPANPYIDAIGNYIPMVGSLVSVTAQPIFPAPGVVTSYSTSCYIIQATPNSNNTGWEIVLSSGIDFSNGDKITFTNQAKGRIPGGWDIHNRNYTVSMQELSNYFPLPRQVAEMLSDGTVQLLPPTKGYKTLNFDDSINGWVSFYTYNPTFMFSLKDIYYSVNSGSIYKHYQPGDGNNHAIFYEVKSESSITFVFNQSPNITKSFLTVNYEGSNGWECDLLESSKQEYQAFPNGNSTFDFSYPDIISLPQVWKTYSDRSLHIRSTTMSGYYDADGNFGNWGFTRKENRYVASILGNNQVRPQEIDLRQDSIAGGKDAPSQGTSGIRGYFAVVKMSTDAETDRYGPKELFAVGTTWQLSSM